RAERWCLMAERRLLFSRRRSLTARGTFFGMRFFGGGAVASASSMASRVRAASRLRAWERNSSARTVRTPRTRRPARRSSARALRCSGRDGEFATSKDSSAAVALVLTCCPPGPEEREKRQRSSDSGIETEPLTCTPLSGASPGMPPLSQAVVILSSEYPPGRTVLQVLTYNRRHV